MLDGPTYPESLCDSNLKKKTRESPRVSLLNQCSVPTGLSYTSGVRPRPPVQSIITLHCCWRVRERARETGPQWGRRLGRHREEGQQCSSEAPKCKWLFLNEWKMYDVWPKKLFLVCRWPGKVWVRGNTESRACVIVMRAGGARWGEIIGQMLRWVNKYTLVVHLCVANCT